MRNNLFTLLLAAMLMTSCGIIKKSGNTKPDNGITDQTNTTADVADTYASVIATLGDWQTMQTGGNIKLSAGSGFSSAIQVRMVRDEAIYISLRPMLGIEVGKLIITADSLYAVDKVHKRYVAEKVSILTSGIPVTVRDVQDMFLGRPFIIGKGTLNAGLKDEVTVIQDDKATILSVNEHYKGYGYSFTFDKVDRITSLDIVPAGSTTAAYQVKYNDVKRTEAGSIAHAVNANATIEKKKVAFSLTYKDIDWNGNLKIDRSIPGNYSRMSAASILSLFSN